MIVSRQHQLLDASQRLVLADALCETASTATTIHALRRNSCRAFALGSSTGYSAAVVEVDGLSGEPFVYGANAQCIWELLKAIDGWECVLVVHNLARELGGLMQTETSCSVRYYGDVVQTLTRPVSPYADTRVRPLSIPDRGLIGSEADDMWPADFAEPERLLQESIVGAAIVNGRVVSRAHAQSWSGRYAEVSVFTEVDWRRRGLATAAASEVCIHLQERGWIPVWSTGEDNWASLRVAQKLGFSRPLERCYVIPVRTLQRKA